MPESGQPPHKRLRLPGAPRLRTLLVGLLGADENGFVSFPERTVRSSRLARTFGVISNTVSLGVHASYGPSAYVLAYGHTVGGKRLEGSAYYHAGEPLPEKLVTRVTALHLN